eukprot:TRINITY_DN293_c1_g1_i1.p1 TRINITY_DN293_c1_g1~~TRINITY_DN293_c1_g1_i1.p1  ORF type:complete len:573 (+),score=286.22 TRINITY_DN293_c1_g1_i1:288-2006(+)
MDATTKSTEQKEVIEAKTSNQISDESNANPPVNESDAECEKDTNEIKVEAEVKPVEGEQENAEEPMDEDIKAETDATKATEATEEKETSMDSNNKEIESVVEVKNEEKDEKSDKEDKEESNADSESDSDDSDSSSDSSDESSSSDDESDDELKQLSNEISKIAEKNSLKSTAPRTATEIDENDPKLHEKIELTLTESDVIAPLAKVLSIVDETVIILESLPEKPTLDIGSIVATEKREVIGKICEPFGPVENPLYVVRFPQCTLEKDQLVCGVVERSNFVEVNAIRDKGYDSSNAKDEECGANECEFSDDEQEMQAKKMKKRERKRKANENAGQQAIMNAANAGAPPSKVPAVMDDSESLPYQPGDVVTPGSVHNTQTEGQQQGRPQRGGKRGRGNNRRQRGSRGRGGRGGARGGHMNQNRGGHGQQQQQFYPSPHHQQQQQQPQVVYVPVPMGPDGQPQMQFNPQQFGGMMPQWGMQYNPAMMQMPPMQQPPQMWQPQFQQQQQQQQMYQQPPQQQQRRTPRKGGKQQRQKKTNKSQASHDGLFDPATGLPVIPSSGVNDVSATSGWPVNL